MADRDMSTFHFSDAGGAIGGQVPSDLWGELQLLFLASSDYRVSQILISNSDEPPSDGPGGGVSTLAFTWGTCGRKRFKGGEVLVPVDPDLLRPIGPIIEERETAPGHAVAAHIRARAHLLVKYAEDFGPRHAEWGPTWELMAPDFQGNRIWMKIARDPLGPRTRVARASLKFDPYTALHTAHRGVVRKSAVCPADLQGNFYLTAHENTIPNLNQICKIPQPELPRIIVSYLTLHVSVDVEHSSHANCLIFILTNNGYLCFRYDPHGFSMTLSVFRPELLDEYLRVYFETNYPGEGPAPKIEYLTHYELTLNYDFPLLQIQHLEGLNQKCGVTGFCATWVIVILHLILRPILNSNIRNLDKPFALDLVKEILDTVQGIIDVDSEIPPTIERDVQTLLPRERPGNFGPTLDEYMVNINLYYSSRITAFIKLCEDVNEDLVRRYGSLTRKRVAVDLTKARLPTAHLLDSIRGHLDTETAFHDVDEPQLLEIILRLMEARPGVITHRGINFYAVQGGGGTTRRKKHKKKLTKKPEKKLTKKKKMPKLRKNSPKNLRKNH